MKTIKIQLVKIILVIPAIIFFTSYNRSSVAIAQTIITNGSFEKYTPGLNPPLPDLIPVSCCIYQTNDRASEVTRCLGWWQLLDTNWNNVYPSLPIICDTGWYSPTIPTPDYFRTDVVQPPPVTWNRPTAPLNAINANGLKPPNKQNPVGWDYDSINNKAYVGINIWKKYDINGNEWFDQTVELPHPYSEYLQKKLNSPLQHGHCYAVSFYVSHSINESYSNIYLYQLGAYFTEEPIPSNKETYSPYYVDPYDTHFVHNEPYAKLKRDGGPLGNEWDIVSSTITVKENENDLWYVTIGNFQNDWKDSLIDGNHTIDPYPGDFSNKNLITYYFIDSLKIEQLNQCGCHCRYNNITLPDPGRKTFYHLSVEPLPKPEDSCCFDIYFEQEKYQIMCSIDSLILKIYKQDDSNRTLETTQIINGPFQQGMRNKIYSYCTNKINGHLTNMYLSADLFNKTNTEVHCFTDTTIIPIRCQCDCDEINYLDFNWIEDGSNDSLCCWILQAKNSNSFCDFHTELFTVSLGYPNNLYSLPYSDWSGTIYNNTYSGWSNTLGYIGSGETSDLFKVCVDRGLPLSANINFDVEHSPHYQNCHITPERDELCNSCCDEIFVRYESIEGLCLDSNNNLYSCCCWNVYASKTNTSCTVTQIIIGDDSLHEQYYYSGYHPEGILFNPTQLLATICIHEIEGQIRNKEIDITFTLKDGTMCFKDTVQSCGHEYGDNSQEERRIRLKDEEINDNKNIEWFYCIPNPATNETAIHYKIKNSSDNKISIHNSLGQTVEILKEGLSSKGEHIIYYNTDKLPSGMYFIKLSAGNEILTRSLSIIR